MSHDYVQSTFKFDRKTEARIEQLKQHYGASSKTEVIRKSLMLLERVKQLEEQGAELATLDRDDNLTRLMIV